ncbi:carboxypeptidase regulatory-like domain-containing protein [Acinetobacter variabilis]|uniref:carboxypeptidase regulatory-like domain-containing protein n=1 Tax=Acinetobacter variabilis TaxID=70346 RepID=UPI00132FADFC|nr:carboxypeptidase regulatory-like domain-containing protein [Acinetobacter variabilis]
MSVVPIINISTINGKYVGSDSVLSIQGTASELGKALPCRIRLFEKVSGRLIKETISTKEGFYKFENLELKKYFIVAHHPASQFNAVIQDNVVPK